jgi:hypothetical protein
MSQVSTVAEHATTIDWNIVAAAVATFCGTMIVTIWGWFQGKKKVSNHISEGNYQVTGFAIQDNQTLREATIINREIRDQLLLQNHALTQSCRIMEEKTRVMEELLEELKRYRHLLER